MPRAAHPHLARLRQGLRQFEHAVPRLQSWGVELAARLSDGARLLTAGNGGSAAEAQHLTAELVGRYEQERLPLSAIALHAETSSVTAITNDYGYEDVFARQVLAHGRAGDVLLLMSTSGESTNLVSAADAGRFRGLLVWALTGPLPNPVARHSDDVVDVPVSSRATVQELHLVAVHVIAGAVDEALATRSGVEDAAVAGASGGHR